MGARPYIPSLGRFLQMDPIEGGTPSAYVYPVDPINQGDYSGENAIALTQGLNVLKVLGTIAATAAAIDLAPVVLFAGAAAVVYATVRTTSSAKAVPQTIPVPANPLKNCATYTPAPVPYVGVKYPAPGSSQYNQKVTAINQTVLLLRAGINPGGFPILGQGTLKPLDKNPLYANDWTKYSVPYPAQGFEVHYSLNELTCQYSDLKTAKLWDK